MDQIVNVLLGIDKAHNTTEPCTMNQALVG